MKQLFALYFILFSTITLAQNKVDNTMSQYLEDNGTMTYYSAVIDRMFDFMKTEFASAKVPDDVWTELSQVKSEALSEISEMISQAYAGHFSQSELQTMLDFYASETGKRIMSTDSLTETQKKEQESFYESDLGQKISSSTESLNGILQKMTQEWSADLFTSVSEKLKAKGFTKQK